MVDRAVNKFGSFFEKLLLWALEGEKSPFNQNTYQPLEVTRKPFRKKRNKTKNIVVLAHT